MLATTPETPQGTRKTTGAPEAEQGTVRAEVPPATKAAAAAAAARSQTRVLEEPAVPPALWMHRAPQAVRASFRVTAIAAVEQPSATS